MAFSKLDSVLNSQVRLGVVSILMKVKSADFKHLKETTGTSAGNLSHQIKKLSEVGYIKVEKSFENNYPKTTLSITKKGRVAFNTYVEAIKGYLDL